MIDDTLRTKIVAIVDTFLAVPSEFDLREVWPEVKYDLRISDDREIKRITLKIVREMLRRGARADFDCGSPTGVHHPETMPDEVLARIDREWAALKGLPDIGDICTFVWTPAALETYRK